MEAMKGQRMLTKNDIIEKALSCGFGDIGFTTASPFEIQKTVLQDRYKEYDWIYKRGLDLLAGTDPKQIFPEAKTIIVLLEVYFNQAFPSSLECHFGRCYLDDDRIIKNNLAQRLKSFRSFLTDQGIDSRVPQNLPQRITAARAGLGTFGKNCLLYSKKLAAGGSWVLPIALMVNREFSPDEPTMEIGCPDWCRNVCLAACPTGALKGPRHIDPDKCISFLTYYGSGITPQELREPMGLWVYGCDRCQNVCPRNAPWLARTLPLNQKVAAMAEHFKLEKLLHMDNRYFKTHIWPHMFYIPEEDIWRWKMNVARVMGNSLDTIYVPELIRAFRENTDQRVLGMIVWALGRIGGEKAEAFLRQTASYKDGPVKKEIMGALKTLAK
jgi:epoxyqueuosine reductase